jgi:hypothetical protein
MEHKDDRVAVYVRQKRPWFLKVPPLSWIVPFKRERRALLDRVGTRLWRMCDGERTVLELVDSIRAPPRIILSSRDKVSAY